MDGEALLNGQESRHALKVLRIQKGDAVELFDGGGRVYAGIFSAVKDGRVVIGEIKVAGAPVRELGALASKPFEITLAVSVIKPNAMDMLIQKSCELGVDKIAPILTERSVIRLPVDRWAAKTRRWRKIALESCKQCRRSQIPEILPVGDFDSFLHRGVEYGKILIPTLAVKGDILYQVLGRAGHQKILVFIGPEGDFTPGEVERAIVKGAKPVCLGPEILRSETAAIYVLSVLNFFYREAVPVA